MDASETAVAAQTPAPLLESLSKDELEALYHSLRTEYNTTVLVVAVLTERLLEATGAIYVQITDEALHQAPDLDAKRNQARRAVLLQTAR